MKAPIAAAVLLIALLFVPGLPTPAHPTAGGHGAEASGFWNIVQGFSTKSGYRYVFTWDTDESIAAIVHYGYSANALTQDAVPIGDNFDTAGVAIIDIAKTQVTGRQVYFHVENLINGDVSPTKSFREGNAWKSDASDGIYEINAIMQVDTMATPGELAFFRDAIDIFAERVWDMTDGYVRIGSVLITDTKLNYPAYVPAGPQFIVGCPNTVNAAGAAVQHTLADFIVQTTVPFDSHTYVDTTTVPEIDDACVGFYIGRLGQLVVTWDGTEHMGYIMTHEFGHYAMGFSDLYDAPTGVIADCRQGYSGGAPDNAAGRYDITVMHNTGGWLGGRWQMTELDRGEAYIDCDYGNQNGDAASSTTDVSWSILHKFYGAVPDAGRLGNHLPDHGDSDYDLLRGNPDGGNLNVFVLEHLAGMSKLSHDIRAGPPQLSVTAGGPYAASINTPIQFTSTVTGGQAPFQYLWTFGDGVSDTTAFPTHAYAAANTYTVALQVTDSTGQPKSAETTATITAPDPPQVNGVSHSSVTQSSASITWNVGGGNPVVSAVQFGQSSLSNSGPNQNGPGPKQYTLQGLTPGTTYAYRVHAQNTASGATADSATQTFTTQAQTTTTTSATTTTTSQQQQEQGQGSGPPANRAPNAYFTYSLNNLSLRADASGSQDPDGDVLTYQWSFGDGAHATGAAVTHDFARQGSYRVELIVMDPNGLSGTSSQQVATPASKGPTAVLTASSHRATPGTAIRFDASKSIAGEAAIVRYEWAFAEGAPFEPAPAVVDRSFASVSNPVIRVRVIDAAGLTDEESIPIEITNEPGIEGSDGDLGPLASGDGKAASAKKSPSGSIVVFAMAALAALAVSRRRQ